MNVIKVGETLTVVFSNGDVVNRQNCSKELHMQVVEFSNNEDKVRELLTPNKIEVKKKVKEAEDFMDTIKTSKILSIYGDSIYIESISEVSVPKELVKEILQAEKDNNQDLIQTYLNFWNFCSCNPDSRARTNLFWFLKKYGMTITKSGLFVAYRLVNIKKEGNNKYSDEEKKFILDTDILRSTKIKKSRGHIYIGKKDSKLVYWVNSRKLEATELLKEKTKVFDTELGTLEFLLQDMKSEGETIYTDQRTGKMIIKIGSPVSMLRKDCDSVQENTCSRGLHAASFDWLERNHCFGKVALKVLINPSSIVAVPKKDNYGKLRTCEYYPLQVLKVKDSCLVDDDLITTGAEIDFIDIISEETEINNEDLEKQIFEIPTLPELSREKIIKNLNSIKEQLSKKVIND